MRRRLLISVSILALVALGIFVGGWLMQPTPRIDEETFDKIKEGMTLREVEAIIGAPPGDYGVGKGELFTPLGLNEIRWFLDDGTVRKDWLGQENAISVWFNADGRVTGQNFLPVDRDYDSNFDRFLGWFGFKAKRQPPAFDIN